MSKKLSPSRLISYDAFMSVFEKGCSPHDVLNESYAKNPSITRIDRNFTKEILFGSLRWYSKIFWILQKTSKRDLLKTTPEIRAALVLGTYQIFYMDKVPDRAAVNESVEYVRAKGQAHSTSFINGILRSIARKTEYFAKPDKKKKPCEYLALQYAHPEWLVRSWSQRFNFDKLKSILAANNQQPPVSIRINEKKVPQEEIADFKKELLKTERVKSSFSHMDYCLTLSEFPRLDKDSFFSRGFYTIQDESSQLISHLVSPKSNELILDACAGLGGKTGHIFEKAPASATVIALDTSKMRAEKAKETFSRLGHEGIEYVLEDLLDYKSEKLFDKILLDSPCSGFGVLRRHPEGKWQKRADTTFELAKKQQKLIEKSLELLKPQGELIFSVCSFELKESLDHLNFLLESENHSVEVVDINRRLPSYYSKYVNKDKILMIYPGNKENMDGFSSFVVKKNS